MPKSKLFWVGMLILVIMVPFIIIWIMAGLGWAIGMLVMVTILVLLTLGGTRRRKRYPPIDDDYGDDRDINININYGGDEERRPPSFPTVVPINKKGVEFITGAKGSRKRQEKDMRRINKGFRKREQDAMRRIKKNLWG